MQSMLPYDPLLSQPNYDLPQFDEAQQQLYQKMQQLKQNSQQQMAAASQSPVWDEIDNIVSGLSNKEMEFIMSNEEFQESNNSVMAILNREYLRIMRPRVESTKDGKDALEKHLTLVKRLKKSAADEVNKKYSLMDDYLENHSDISFQEYLEKAKKGGKKK